MMRMIAIGYESGEPAGIVEALQGGNGERARAAMVNHILMIQERVLKRELGTPC